LPPPHFTYYAGSGMIGTGLVGLMAGATAFGVFSVLFVSLLPPILRLAMALVFSVPAAIAGYALVHGMTHETVPLQSGGRYSASSAGHSSASRRCCGFPARRPRSPP
jgi:membrane protein implicated in regulation of membrane protease activity